MNLYLNDKAKPERGEDVGKSLMQMIDENLNITGSGFRPTFTKFERTSNIKIIYDSELCRVKFTFSRQQDARLDELTIQYGRLHAPSEEPFMEWQGSLCNCWHYIFEPLRFLDGLSPFDAVQQVKIKKETPVVVETFRNSEVGKKLLDEYPPKAAIVMHSGLWNHYGQRLFDLFDIRKPKLWEEYKVFVREYYKLLGMKTSFGPPYENIC